MIDQRAPLAVMSAASEVVEVRRVAITREEIDYGHPEIAEALAAVVGARGGERFRLPLAKERFEVEIAGVPTVVANALRRVIKDEMRGRCLTFDNGALDREETTDPFMSDEDFILTRVRMIPLRPQISEHLVKTLRFTLDAQNETDTEMAVYSGDLIVTEGALTEPIFNPTHEIASLQPGRTLRIGPIYITEGYGTQDAAFNVATRTAARPLDLEEVPRADTHNPGGPRAQRSGFLESSLVAQPRRHLVSGYLPAVPAGGTTTTAVLADACGVIMERLKLVQNVLDIARQTDAKTQEVSEASYNNASAYFMVTPDEGRTKGVLKIKNETDTIAQVLTRTIYELKPDISFVGATVIPHERAMRLTVAHPVSEPDEIGEIVARAAKHAYNVFSQIQRGIRGSP